MKNVAILAVLLGILGSNVNAESAVSEAPELTLAMNSGNTANLWVAPATANTIDNEALAEELELKVNKSMEKVADAMDKLLEEKMAKEIEYAVR